jgi:hypothetical protein
MPTRAQTTPPPGAMDVALVVDRSGSMVSCGSAINEGVYGLIHKHAETAKKMPGTPYNLRLVSFDDAAEVLYDGPISELMGDNDQLHAPKMAGIYIGLFPRGRTRLIRTLSEELVQQAERVAQIRMAWHPSVQALHPRIAVSISIITDGFDNLGGDIEELHRLVDSHQSDIGAACQFVAANQDAKKTGAKYGFKGELCLQMDADPGHARAAMSCVAASSTRAVTGGNPNFSAAERMNSSIAGF